MPELVTSSCLLSLKPIQHPANDSNYAMQLTMVVFVAPFCTMHFIIEHFFLILDRYKKLSRYICQMSLLLEGVHILKFNIFFISIECKIITNTKSLIDNNSQWNILVYTAF